jgi:cobalt-zinc-cadmium efflux system outer membrane protein
MRSVYILAFSASACWGGRSPSGTSDVARSIERPGAALGLDVPDPRVAEAALGGAAVTGDDVVLAVLATSPELAAERARARAELAEVAADSALPPPELELALRGQPLERPWDLGEADMIMVGLRQEILAGGKRDALARVALADAEIAAAAVTSRELELAGRARRAHAAWYLASREVALHDEHLTLVHAMVDAISAAYRANRARVEDVTRVEMTVAALHLDLTSAEERLISARAMINALAGRDPGAALGTPAAPTSRLGAVDVDALAALQERSRAELRAAGAAARREAAGRDAARADRWPRLMVGASYDFMPADHAYEHRYGLMLSMTLPWLDRSIAPRAEAARHREVAERAGEDATRATLRYELAAAAATLRAARARDASLRDEQLPRAERLYEAVRLSFSTNAGDASSVLAALDGWLALRIDAERAVAELAAAEADLERAVGAPLTTEVTP